MVPFSECLVEANVECLAQRLTWKGSKMKAVEQENLTCLDEREASCYTWGFHIGCVQILNILVSGKWYTFTLNIWFAIETRTDRNLRICLT